MSEFLTGASAIAAAIGVIVAARTFAFNSKVNRAKFLYDLHRDFFINDTYTEGKERIDKPSDPDKLSQAVSGETENLIGLLNFFETSRLLHPQQRTDTNAALVGYYLDQLSRHVAVADYLTAEGPASST